MNSPSAPSRRIPATSTTNLATGSIFAFLGFGARQPRISRMVYNTISNKGSDESRDWKLCSANRLKGSGRIDVDKSSYHQLSQTEIASDNPSEGQSG
jgi:hypothetical protein